MTYEVVASPRQQDVLTWMVAQLNTELGTNLTVAQFVQLRFNELIVPFDLRYTQWEAEEVKKRFTAAESATKETVKDSLGM